MAQLKTKCGKLITIDDCDFDLLNKKRWHLNSGKYAVASIKTGYYKYKLVRLHRIVLGMSHEDLRVVDHMNGDKLDNRRSNLRICTSSQNARNRKIHSNNKSGYKGVSLHKASGLYTVKIRVEGKTINVGYFKNDIIAANAYNDAALKYHGEFARLNKI